MDRGIPTEAVLAEKPWQEVRPHLRVKLLPQDGEVYVLAETEVPNSDPSHFKRNMLICNVLSLIYSDTF